MRSNSGVRNSASSARTCRLMAACVTLSSSAAREKLDSRAAASNAFSALSGGNRRAMADVTKTYTFCKVTPFVVRAEEAHRSLSEFKNGGYNDARDRTPDRTDRSPALSRPPPLR
ncbi:exported protein of unknown function [Hyphomicrobium sp. MC1]|nr:exported protein of unknown function [Hyphomicrobium sp. MC1]